MFAVRGSGGSGSHLCLARMGPHMEPIFCGKWCMLLFLSLDGRRVASIFFSPSTNQCTFVSKLAAWRQSKHHGASFQFLQYHFLDFLRLLPTIVLIHFTTTLSLFAMTSACLLFRKRWRACRLPLSRDQCQKELLALYSKRHMEKKNAYVWY